MPELVACPHCSHMSIAGRSHEPSCPMRTGTKSNPPPATSCYEQCIASGRTSEECLLACMIERVHGEPACGCGSSSTCHCHEQPAHTKSYSFIGQGRVSRRTTVPAAEPTKVMQQTKSLQLAAGRQAR